MGLSIGHLLLVVVLFLLLFGRGKLPALMGDIAEGIKNFRKGIQDERAPDSPAAGADSSKSGTS